jgi:hypothetical protein
MKNLSTFEEFLNEERVYGMFNDSQGKPSKLSQEILEICMRGLPKKITDQIEEVEAAGYFKHEMNTPPTTSNKGQSRGVADYTSIVIVFKKPLGKGNVDSLEVGIRKRTSGPGTGYLAVAPFSGGSRVLPEKSIAIEWMDSPEAQLERLYNDNLKNIIG